MALLWTFSSRSTSLVAVLSVQWRAASLPVVTREYEGKYEGNGVNLRCSELKQFRTFGTPESGGLLQHAVHFDNPGKTGVCLLHCRLCFRCLRRALIRSLGGEGGI